MKKLGSIHFRGRSGKRYRFDAYPLDAEIEAGMCGVFVATQRKPSKTRPGFAHVRKATGQSEDLAASLTEGEKTFAERGVNCFCVHAQADEAVRQSIARDLLRKRRPPVDKD